ncbi:hypothetical protein [Curtobacterium sp. MCBD17_008]|uniref:hypothetical protein n=1 Tax=Curtobacterium sp. MCBD17_008 TaxID=2175656 RepID=UPI000DA780D6|nr:hypothetical protein [Curtobacterium sp. MCBD17_008]PZE92912.1 hypothetical protein DEI95_08110 [Curtobacterium sp. MCBD17_008]
MATRSGGEAAASVGTPTSRLLLHDGTVTDDPDKASAIDAMFTDGYFTDELPVTVAGGLTGGGSSAADCHAQHVGGDGTA